jgi:hypothetical protein
MGSTLLELTCRLDWRAWAVIGNRINTPKMAAPCPSAFNIAAVIGLSSKRVAAFMRDVKVRMNVEPNVTAFDSLFAS